MTKNSALPKRSATDWLRTKLPSWLGSGTPSARSLRNSESSPCARASLGVAIVGGACCAAANNGRTARSGEDAARVIPNMVTLVLLVTHSERGRAKRARAGPKELHG